MDQSSQFDHSDPFFTPLPPLPRSSSASDASDALSLPPLATYPSKEALYKAIQSWSKPRGYAFTVIRSKRVRNGRRKVYYTCDRHPSLRPEARTERVRDTQSRGSRWPGRPELIYQRYLADKAAWLTAHSDVRPY